MTRDDLARFRAGFASCELVMLVDTSAGTVLASDSALHQGQERLDALCDMASALLAGDLPASTLAILAGPRGSRVFLRAPDDPAEVLCGLFAPDADLPAACAAAAQLFDAGATA